jgi:Rhodopirellula transposase DDE domain
LCFEAQPLVAATTTGTGVNASQSALDKGYFPGRIKVTDAELAAVPLRKHDWHPNWTYSILAST